MKFEDILFKLLTEQAGDDLDWMDEPEPEENDDQPEQDPNNELPNDEVDPNDAGVDGREQEDEINTPEPPEEAPVAGQPQRPRGVNPIVLLKRKWVEEGCTLNEDDLNSVLILFNRKKNGFRPYVDPESPNYGVTTSLNLPEIAAIHEMFPDFPVTNLSILKDATKYPWVVMSFLMDRISTIQMITDINYDIGDVRNSTREDLVARARQLWDRSYNRIVHQDNLTVFKVEGKDESTSLGRLQHLMVARYGENMWCITVPPGGGTNYYDSYRDRRSQYFLLDENRQEDDVYYISVIGVVDMTKNRNEGPFTITNRRNRYSEEQTHVSWGQIIEIWPQLTGKENLFKIIPKTQKESGAIPIAHVIFRAGDPNDFVAQTPQIQMAYIAAGNPINSPRAFRTLQPPARQDYINLTTRDNYKTRYRSNIITQPFGMLDVIKIETPNLYRYLDETILKSRVGLPNGVLDLKKAIIGVTFKEKYTDPDRKIVMYYDDFSDRYGLYNFETLEWIKPFDYIRGMTKIAKTQDRKTLTMITFSISTVNGNDYFYWLLPLEAMNKKSTVKFQGSMLSREEGDYMLQNGVIKRI
jgi:hypothetical protein